MPIDLTLHLAAPLRRDHRFGAALPDLFDRRPLVVAPIGDDCLRLVVGQRRLGLANVRLLRRRQGQLDGVTEPVEAAVALRPEATSAVAEGRLGLAAGAAPCVFPVPLPERP